MACTAVAINGRDASPNALCSLAPWNWDEDDARAPLSNQEAAALWDRLLNDDGESAYHAVWWLAVAKNGAEALAGCVKPTREIEEAAVRESVERLAIVRGQATPGKNSTIA